MMFRKYNDKRAAAKGKLPDDAWEYIRVLILSIFIGVSLGLIVCYFGFR